MWQIHEINLELWVFFSACSLGGGAVRFGHFIAGLKRILGVVLGAFDNFPCEFPNLSNRRISTGIFSGSGRTML